jgi:hypothetical protein
MRVLTPVIYHAANTLRHLGVPLHEERDARVQEMQRRIHGLGRIEFLVEQETDGTWAAESTNIEGIIFGGNDIRRFPDVARAAVFAYFEIPPHLCNDALLRTEGEPVQIRQRVYA